MTTHPRPRRVRAVLARLWANRPTLGALAFLLAGPGVANVLLGLPLWWAAAGQWSLWLLLMVAVSITEARRPAPPADHVRPGGHDVPSHLGTGTAEEADR
ncbi:hypothetical protein [Actinomadura rudentiformis]|uniref:Uncharacterized protein n=1 Tax=Actinomadura rudentiformis TaxID=359158 RepID=A0A6H9YMN6_9ACTN|nr:hypothetical protein [Actinomadura rudentiformis]KAB2347252.1 hypothetical protein F8566_19710 [Actinomadura rudentiformis]